MLTVDIQFHYDCLSCQLSITLLLSKNIGFSLAIACAALTFSSHSQKKNDDNGRCVCGLHGGGRERKEKMLRDSCFQMQWIMLMSWRAPFISGHVISRIFKTTNEYIFICGAYFSSLYAECVYYPPHFSSFSNFDNAIFWFLIF